MRSGIIEIWKPIAGFEGRYEVSSLGRVKSLAFERPHSNRSGVCKCKEKIRKSSLMPNGYMHIVLCSDKKSQQFYVHRLVAAAFLPKREGATQVNHKNGVRDDNRLENIEWVTPGENLTHKYRVLKTPHPRNNLGKTGANNMLSIPIDVYDLNGNFLYQHTGIEDLARKIGCSPCTISAVIHGRITRYRNITFKRANTTKCESI